MTLKNTRIPLHVVGKALRQMVYTDSLIPSSVGESQCSWHVPGSLTLTYVDAGQRIATRYITNEAEMLAVIAFMVDHTFSASFYLDDNFSRFLHELRFTNCTRLEYVLVRLAALRVKMIIGNIEHTFSLIHCLRNRSGLPYFQIGPELMSASHHLYTNCSFEGYDRLTQPLARRIYRAFARQDLVFGTPYTAEDLCHILRFYRPAQPAAAYVIEPLPMYQVRERLFRVQNELIQAGFISMMSEENVEGKAALSFLPGKVTVPEWPSI